MITEAKLINREIWAEFVNRAQEIEHITLYTVGERAMCLTYRPSFGSSFLKHITPSDVGKSVRRP